MILKKPLNKLGIEESFFYLIKNMYKNPTANGDEAFPKIRNKARMSFLTTSAFQRLSRSLANAIRKEKEIKDIDWEGGNETILLHR